MPEPREVVYEVLEIYDEISRGYSSWRTRAWELVRVLRGGVVLDLGSGHCVNGLHLAKEKEVDYLICVDIAPSMLLEARRLARRKGFYVVDLVAADATAIPLRDSAVDSLISIALVHHLPREELRKTVNEVARVLRPAGMTLLTSWSKRQLRFVPRTLAICLMKLSGIRGLYDYRVRWRTRRKTYTRRYFLYEVEELEELAEKAGLEVTSRGYVSRSNSLNVYIVAVKHLKDLNSQATP